MKVDSFVANKLRYAGHKPLQEEEGLTCWSWRVGQHPQRVTLHVWRRHGEHMTKGQLQPGIESGLNVPTLQCCFFSPAHI